MAEQVEGLRIGAVGSRLVEHLHLFAAADHHGVLGRPLPVLRIRVGCVPGPGGPAMTVLQTINTMAAGMGTIMAQVLHSGWSLAMIARASLVGIDHILFFQSLDCLPRVPDGTSISLFAMRLRGSSPGAGCYVATQQK